MGLRVDLSHFDGDRNDLMDFIYLEAEQFYAGKEKEIGEALLRQVERFIYLETIDRLWKEHLQAMDHLREGIHFRGYAQKDPKQEYKREGFIIFTSMMHRLKTEVLEKVFKAEIQQGNKEKITNDISKMQQARRKEAEKLKKILALKQNEETAKSTPSAPVLPNPSRPFTTAPKVEEQHLNRHQRRLIKAQERKDKKHGS